MHPGSTYRKANRPNRSGRGGGAGNNGGNMGSGAANTSCFACGQLGHLARNCPNTAGGVSEGFRGNRGGWMRRGQPRGYQGPSLSSAGAPFCDGGGYQVDNNIRANQSIGAASDKANATTKEFAAMPTEADMSTWRQKDYLALVKAFVENNESQELAFPSTLNGTQRNHIHRIAMIFGLEHKSYGVEPKRYLKLTKASGTVAMQQQQREEAAANGERIKTIDGFQGAQLLPDRFIDRSKLDDILKSLQVHRKKMIHDIKLEANRPVEKSKKFHAAQPGLSSPPSYRRDAQKFTELQRFRQTLPTYKRRDEIVNAVRNNDVIIVSGDTGCGKTTQIPQMLYDAKIFPPGTDVICTQPRRISALSVAQRVAEERGEACGDTCGYVIRFENVTSKKTHIVYQTTGILLRRLHSEPELRGVACVIVDEVHERDLDTDFSLLLLRDRLAAQRADPEKYPQKLKIVVMSATVQIDSLVKYFSASNGGRPAPLITIPGTLFPVQEFFLEDAIAWVGGSKSDAATLAFLERKNAGVDAVDTEGMTLYEKLRSSVFNDQDRDAEAMVPYDLACKLIVYIHRASLDFSGSVLVFLPGWAAITRIADMLRRSEVAKELSVLMLHSNLTSAEQQRVFLPPPKRYRKVVLATSIAETSITIDDVVYVIDSGLIKGTSYDPSGNTSALQATMIAKANGIQRRGRAGRCREGVCVHLLPKSVYNELRDFLPPEIVRSPLEEICLQVKAIRAEERCTAVLARAMDPPPANSVEHAVSFLTDMGAFTQEEELLTNLGRALAQLPLHPLLGKMLFTAAIFGVLESVATIAAGLSVKSPFVKPLAHQKAACRESLQRLDNGDLSDHLCVLKLHQGWVRSGRSFQYANDHFADASTLRSLDRTKLQLVRLVQHSPLLRRWKEPLREASRNDGNTGLVRLTMLVSLYPRLATLEYRANRHETRANLFCWDNKPATFSQSSALAFRKRQDFGANSFVMYYERMQLESTLNLFDSSILSAVDVALCVRQLIVRPLVKIPNVLLQDKESKMAPPVRLDLDQLENKEQYAGMFFDGDKKLYIAETPIANALEMGRECMDYYLALCIKKLRADAFPQDLVSTLAMLIGFPLSAVQTNGGLASADQEAARGATVEDGFGNQGNTPAFVGAGYSDVDLSDEEGDGPIIVDEEEEDIRIQLQLSDDQRKKVTSAFGDLAIFRQAQVAGLDTPDSSDDKVDGHKDVDGEAPAVAKVTIPSEKLPTLNTTNNRDDDGVDDDDDDDDDIIVAQPGALRVSPILSTSATQVEKENLALFHTTV